MPRLRFTAVLAVAGATALLAAPVAARAQDDAVPAPTVLKTTLGDTPLIQLTGGGGGLPDLESTASLNAGDWEGALSIYHDSGTYDRQLWQIGSPAKRWVRKHAKTVKGAKPAIVLDVDETTLSNYTAIKADAFTFGVNSRAEAQNQIGTAIAPTTQIVKEALKDKVTVFFVTGRREGDRVATASNFAREGFGTYKQLVLKPTAFTGTTVAYKAGARAAIEKQGYRIIANVGDQFSDLAGGHALRDFKYPNPFYYLP